jgi:signal transduction histidine kinase
VSLAFTQDVELSGEAFCALAFRSAPTAMARVSRIGGAFWICDANDAFLQLFSLQRSLPRHRLRRVFRGASAEQVRQAVAQCLDDGEPAALRITHGSKTEFLLLEIEARRILQAEAAFVLLSASPAHQPQSLSSLGEAGVLAEIGALSRGLVYIHDYPRGMIRCAYHPLLDRIGVAPGAMPVSDALRFVDPADHALISRFLKRQLAAADGEIVQCVHRVRTTAGETLWVSVRSQVFTRTPEGRVQRCLNVATDETEHYRHRAEMAAAERALVQAELDERRRIGRELHDSTAQLLLAARLELSALSAQRRLAGEPLERLEDARQAIEEAQQEIRNVSFVLHPPALLEAGLEDCLRTFAAGFARRTGLKISVDVGEGRRRLPFTAKVALFRVAQEALMNVHRHARARSASLRLTQSARRTMLEVADDGIGLPAGFGQEMEGVGISGMRGRMIQVGGRLEVQPGLRGVLVRASVESQPPPPWTRARRGEIAGHPVATPPDGQGSA